MCLVVLFLIVNHCKSNQSLTASYKVIQKSYTSPYQAKPHMTHLVNTHASNCNYGVFRHQMISLAPERVKPHYFLVIKPGNVVPLNTNFPLEEISFLTCLYFGGAVSQSPVAKNSHSCEISGSVADSSSFSLMGIATGADASATKRINSSASS